MARRKTLPVLTLSTPSAAGTYASATFSLPATGNAALLAELAAPTGATCDVYIEDSWDGGSSWQNVAHFPQLAGGATVTYRATVPPPDGTIRATGKGTTGTPALSLAANTLVPGHWGALLRIVAVVGASGSGGAVTQRVTFTSSNTNA